MDQYDVWKKDIDLWAEHFMKTEAGDAGGLACLLEDLGYSRTGKAAANVALRPVAARAIATIMAGRISIVDRRVFDISKLGPDRAALADALAEGEG